MIKKICLWSIRLYQYCVSPLLGNTCRFWPSCSHYAHEAFSKHTCMKALQLTCLRLIHCSGFSKKWPHGGVDLVPPASTSLPSLPSSLLSPLSSSFCTKTEHTDCCFSYHKHGSDVSS